MKADTGDRVFYLFNYFLLGLLLLTVAYPLLYILSCSFSSSRAVIAGRVFLWPVEPTFLGYSTIFKNQKILLGYANSVFYTVFGTLLSTTLTLLAAYPLSRNDFILKNPIMFLFSFTMFFSGGLIPTYLLISRLGLLDTRAVLIVPGALSVYNVIITRTFFKSNIADELLEASQIDGCSDFKFFSIMVIPLSKAIIAVISLFYAVGIWNSYFDAMIYLSSKELYPLQIILREILVQNKVDAQMIAQGQVNVHDIAAKQAVFELLKYSLIVVASLPVLIIYPFVQKYFVKGVMIGAIKG